MIPFLLLAAAGQAATPALPPEAQKLTIAQKAAQLVNEAPAEPAVAFYPILWINLLVAGVVGFAVSIVIVVLSAQVSRYREKALW